MLKKPSDQSKTCQALRAVMDCFLRNKELMVCECYRYVLYLICR